MLESRDDESIEIARRNRDVSRWLGDRTGRRTFQVDAERRGLLKLALVRAGFPPDDEAGYTAGTPLAFELRETTRGGLPFQLRDYQDEASRAFEDVRHSAGGSGVIVLPCGAGKTIVGLACMHALQTTTLILCTSVTAAKQWIAETLDKTTLTQDQIGIYAGPKRALRPLTVATYQMLTHRRRSDEPMVNLEVFDRADWGLIIYDEVHLLPAPVFQITAALQARRRLGLTATLVREDGLEEDVFALIGPKKAEVPWRELERQGWVATAHCTEMRLPLPPALRMEYAAASPRQQFPIAAQNPDKRALVRALLSLHRDDRILVMSMYVDQIKGLADALDMPVLTGASSQKRRDTLFRAFRDGEVRCLAVSKIGSLAIDLPDANVAIQISGTFGSRQEEAQRLGRILRPKSDGTQAHFYSLVSAAIRGAGIRHEPAALPLRTGLRVRHRRRPGRRAGDVLVGGGGDRRSRRDAAGADRVKLLDVDWHTVLRRSVVASTPRILLNRAVAARPAPAVALPLPRPAVRSASCAGPCGPAPGSPPPPPGSCASPRRNGPGCPSTRSRWAPPSAPPAR